ncbi:MAG: serine/threonine protein kinase [Polyangiaceae bacterium]|nr:serine/threonine protein kinase [Polyangiaceae bacterium]
MRRREELEKLPDSERTLQRSPGGASPTTVAKGKGSSNTLPSGSQLGPYVVESLLGEGGMATVYGAFLGARDRKYALKVLKVERRLASKATDRHEIRERFLREGRAAQELDHPHIVRVFEVREDQDELFLVMEYVNGEAFAEILNGIRKRSIPVATKVCWLKELAEALEYAHSMGILHRDVKPENVLLSEDGAVKLTDFGIAKRVDGSGSRDEESVTSTGIVVGTPLYMSPEQIIGDELDGRSDQFSWAVIAYELLSNGVHPTSHNPRGVEIPYVILQEKPLPLRQYASSLPHPIHDLVMKALSKKPADRYRSMGEIARELEKWEKRESRVGTLNLGKTRGLPIVENADGVSRREFPWPLLAGLGILAALLSFLLLRAVLK